MKEMVLAILLTAFFTMPVFSGEKNGVEKNVSNFLNKIGMANNVSVGGADEDQRSGFYTGGQMYARTGIENSQLAHLDMPGYRAGCGGIDLYLGSFSYINSRQLIKTLQATAQNAVGVAFEYGVQTSMPQVYNIMKNGHHLASMINNSNINSCNLAQGLVGGLWAQTQAAERLVCSSSTANSGKGDDWSSGWQSCTTDSRSRIQSADSSYKGLMAGDHNIVWEAIQKNSWLQKDHEFAELVMSIAGTVIINHRENGNNNKTEVKYLQPLLRNQDLLTALFQGGNVEIYSCGVDKTECLNPTTRTVNISPDHSFKNNVNQAIIDIKDNIINAKPLEDKQKAIVNIVRFPIRPLAVFEAAVYRKDNNAISLSTVVNYVAYEFMINFLQSVLTQVYSSLKAINITGKDEVKDFIRSLTEQMEMLDRSFQNETALRSNAKAMLDLLEHKESQFRQEMQSYHIPGGM